MKSCPQQPGLIGRMVSLKVSRGEGTASVTADEVCEVVACQTAGSYGNWSILVATHDGCVIETTFSKIRLVGFTGDGPYRT